jgi:hypothetical protein
MFEFILIIAAVIAMARAAEADSQTGLKWGAITFAACLLSLIIPIPYIRVGLACLAVFVAMTMTKKTYY